MFFFAADVMTVVMSLLLLHVHTLWQQDFCKFPHCSTHKKQQRWCFKPMVRVLPTSEVCNIRGGTSSSVFPLELFLQYESTLKSPLSHDPQRSWCELREFLALASKWIKTFLFISVLDKENEVTVSHEVQKSDAGVENLSVTWMVFVSAINISTCAVFMQGRPVEQCVLCVQHNDVFEELKSNILFHSITAAVWAFNYWNICEGSG